MGHRSLQAAVIVSTSVMVIVKRDLTGHGVDRSYVRRVLCKHNSEAGLEVEVDVAMKEPRSGVVGLQYLGIRILQLS